MKMATDKQTEYIYDLLRKRVVEDRWRQQVQVDITSGLLDQHRASNWISWLRKQPYISADPWNPVTTDPALSAEAARKARDEELASRIQAWNGNLAPGVYSWNGRLYRVVKRRTDNRRLDVHLIDTTGEKPTSYRAGPGAQRGVRDSGHRLSVAEAAEYGLETGWCIVCGRRLTDPKSVKAGIGPVCITRQGSASV